jgi:hypothetical protein
MVTDIYMANNKQKKSNLKAVSMFDENSPPLTQEEFNNRKRVQFSGDNDQQKVNKKRKNNSEASSNENSTRSLTKSAKTEKLDLIRFARFLFDFFKLNYLFN